MSIMVECSARCYANRYGMRSGQRGEHWTMACIYMPISAKELPISLLIFALALAPWMTLPPNPQMSSLTPGTMDHKRTCILSLFPVTGPTMKTGATQDESRLKEKDQRSKTARRQWPFNPWEGYVGIALPGMTAYQAKTRRSEGSHPHLLGTGK
ncbi:hypothetical protein GGS20DRAFT_560352 [Poronia punctata]|nr:hypothetical protein GGS20DRAFT_560352 [Poronia punctata]